MPDKVIAISSKDGRNSMIFHSIKECAEHFGQTEKYIKYLIDSGEKYKQFYFDFYEGEGVDVDRLFCKGNDNTDTDMSDGIVIAMKLVIMYRIETDAVVINTLVPTIRKEGSHIIWTYNPLTEHDPVKELIVDRADDLTYIRHINSDEVEALLSKEIIAEREKMRREDPDMFAHVWLGQPLTSRTGSVFGSQIARAEIDGRIGNVPYDASAGVYAVFDLGVSDSTAIWWYQMIGREIHMIDYYENSGQELGHYISMLHNKGYNYTTIYLPHDAKQRELQTGKTRVQFFEDNGFHNLEVLRPTNFNLGDDDINLIARPAFSRVWIDRDKCQRGLECLRAYHYEYDEKNKLLKSKPEHDWSSHASSAFIYAMMAATESSEAQQVKVKFKTYVPKAFRQKDKDNEWY